MASSAIARLTGTVLRTQHRDGIAKGSGNPYSMEIITVLVAGVGTTELSFFTSDVAKLGGVLPEADDYIDWAIEVSRSERGFNTDVLSVWPQAYSDEQAARAEELAFAASAK
jgi:hypothetical protein